MRTYLSVVILLLPLFLPAQSEDNNPFGEQDIQLFVMLNDRYEIVQGEIGKKNGGLEILAETREVFFQDFSSRKRTKSFRSKSVDTVTRKMFAYMEKVQEGNANFQYDFVFRKTPEGFLIQLYP